MELQDRLFQHRSIQSSSQAAVVVSISQQQLRYEACRLWCTHTSGNACQALMKSQLHLISRQMADPELQQTLRGNTVGNTENHLQYLGLLAATLQ